MKVFIVISAILAVGLAQTNMIDESPKPYSFSYLSEGEEGTSGHSETADGSGTVRGSYTLTTLEGLNRIVEYVAGPEGFTANIRTNEPGTENAAPADVTVESSAEGAKPMLLNAPARVPEARPVAIRPAAAAPRQAGVRYVLVPADDPRATAYYGRN